MTASTEAQGVINELIGTCIDGQHIFEAAAKMVDDPTLKDELVGYSWQRQQFATDLKNRMKAVGDEPANSGSFAGSLHKGWVDLKTAVGANSGHSALAECEREEDSAKAAYQRALQQSLTPEYVKVVQTQFQTIQRTHDRIKALRDAAKQN